MADFVRPVNCEHILNIGYARKVDEMGSSDLTVVLKQALRTGLPIPSAVIRSVVLELPSIVRRLGTNAELADRHLLFERLLRQLLRRLRSARRVGAARCLFGLASLRGELLTTRRRHAAAAMGCEYNHFRQRIEPGLIAELVDLFRLDGARAARVHKDLQRPANSPLESSSLRHTARGSAERRPQGWVKSERAKMPFVVVSDDVILRAGLVEVLRQSSTAVVFSCDHSNLDLGAIPRGEVSCLVETTTVGSLDRYQGIDSVRRLSATDAHEVTVINRTRLDPLVVLRVVEAGAKFLVDYEQVSRDPTVLFEDFPPESARLATRWAIREAANLAWDGDIAAYLADAGVHGEDVWRSQAQRQLRIGRREVARLRELAHRIAGVPAPDFHRYAMSFRSAPVTPEWNEVQTFTRAILGLQTERATIV